MKETWKVKWKTHTHTYKTNILMFELLGTVQDLQAGGTQQPAEEWAKNPHAHFSEETKIPLEHMEMDPAFTLLRGAHRKMIRSEWFSPLKLAKITELDSIIYSRQTHSSRRSRRLTTRPACQTGGRFGKAGQDWNCLFFWSNNTAGVTPPPHTPRAIA